MHAIKGFHIQDSLFVVRLSFVHPATIGTPHRDFWRPKILIKLFLGEMNGGLNGIIKLQQLCDALPSEKLRIFMLLQKPLTCHEKIWHQSRGKKNTRKKWMIPLWPLNINHAQYFGKTMHFLFAFQRWQTTLVTGLTLSIPITQNLKQIRIKLWPCC